jgi:hypothetical protein
MWVLNRLIWSHSSRIEWNIHSDTTWSSRDELRVLERDQLWGNIIKSFLFIFSLIYKPSLYWIPKWHKWPFKQRYIAGCAKCSTNPLSKLLTCILSAINVWWTCYSTDSRHTYGYNQCSSSNRLVPLFVSICRCCWNFATYKWNVHNGKMQIISLVVKFRSKPALRLMLTGKLLNQGFLMDKLKSSLR